MSNYGAQNDGPLPNSHFMRSEKRYITADALDCMRRQALHQPLGIVANFLTSLDQEGWQLDTPNHCFTDPDQVEAKELTTESIITNI